MTILLAHPWCRSGRSLDTPSCHTSWSNQRGRVRHLLQPDYAICKVWSALCARWLSKSLQSSRQLQGPSLYWWRWVLSNGVHFPGSPWTGRHRWDQTHCQLGKALESAFRRWNRSGAWERVEGLPYRAWWTCCWNQRTKAHRSSCSWSTRRYTRKMSGRMSCRCTQIWQSPPCQPCWWTFEAASCCWRTSA